MSKQGNTGSSIKGWVINIIIGLLIILCALGYAAYSGINLGGPFSFLQTIFKGNKEEIEKSAKDTKNAVKEKFSEASNALNSSSSEQTAVSQEETLGETTAHYEALSFTGEKIMYNARMDEYNRAVSGHIQLKYSDKPAEKRDSKITYDPEGWHNYRFKYEDENGKIKKSYLMNRGHLIGYLFSGLNSEPQNIIPITRYLNSGTMADKKTDPENPYSMLFYETALNQWLKEHPDYTLDYYVVANYTEDELIPRSVSLFWTGFDADGKHIKVELKDPGKANYDGITGSVTLLNISKNAKIDYKTGEATALLK